MRRIAGPSVLLGGNGDDTLIGGTNDDELRGGSGSDDIDGGEGYDVLAYHRPATSGPFTHGVFVNLSDDAVTYEFLGEDREVAAHSALDNWWDPRLATRSASIRLPMSKPSSAPNYDDVIIGGYDSREDRRRRWYGHTRWRWRRRQLRHGRLLSRLTAVPRSPRASFVNISSEAATFDFNGDLDVTVGAGQAFDNWGNTDTVANFENISGSDLDDVLVAGSDYNFIDGGWGDDIIVGGGGYDTLVGGGGSDSFVFGTEWGDTWIEDFELGTDLLRFPGRC